VRWADEPGAGRRSALARGRPLAWHLGLLCAALLLPMLALETYLLFRIAASERARHEAVARDQARQIAVSLDRGLATLGAVAQMLATSDHLLGNDLEAFRRRLRQMPPISNAGVVLRGPDGTVLLAEGAVRPGAREVVAEIGALATGRPQFSGLLRDHAEAAPGFAVLVPVESATAGSARVLSLRIPVAELQAMLARENVPEGMTATITDRAGTVLARTRDAPRLIGTRPGSGVATAETEGWRRGLDADGEPVVLAYARSEVAGWTAWVLMPEHDFAAPLRRSLAATAVLAVLFAALATVLAVSFARRIARPITELAQAVKTGEDIAPATPIREVNALADAHAATRAEAQRLRDAQAELRRIARVNEMGALAAALAHEINQPLTAAATFAEGALRLMPDTTGDPRLAAASDAIREAADQAVQAGRIVGRLRAFLAASDGERTPTDLNELLREAVRLALADARQRGIALRLDLEPGLPPLVLDRVQIGQVVVNLVRNAVEAIGGSARKELRVATRRCGTDRVEVSVADTGPGVAAEVRACLFSPFVSTKPDGMGVGLAISRGIVEDHGGRLRLAPDRAGGEQGAVFRFTLPLHAAASQDMEAGLHVG
jgi:signal transduction histidine kinase